MLIELGLPEPSRGLYGTALQGAIAIALILTAGQLLKYRSWVDSLERPLLSFPALLLLSCGLGYLLGGLQPWYATPHLLTAWYIGLGWLIVFSLWRLQRLLPELQGRSQQSLDPPEHDPLTGLPERQGFALAFDQIRNYYTGSDLEHTLLLVHITGIQTVNHSYGTYAGDTILMQMAQLLQDKTRTLDTVARLSEDQFGVLLAGCSLAQGLAVAENLRDSVAEVYLSDLPNPSPLTIFIGAAPFAQPQALETCWGQAERALAQAKQQNNRIGIPPSIGLLPLSIAYETPQI